MYIYTFMCVCRCIFISLHIYMYMYICISIYTHIHIYDKTIALTNQIIADTKTLAGTACPNHTPIPDHMYIM